MNIPSLIPKSEGICDKCGADLKQRPDDNDITVRERLAVYHAEAEPVLDYYRERGIVVNILKSSTSEKEITKSIKIVAERVKKPGDDIKEKIENMIKSSSRIIALLTRKAINSEMVQWELSLAERYNVKIIPLNSRAKNL